MSCFVGSEPVTSGLVLSFDAANVNKSYPGPLGSELVTDTRLLQIDGVTANVFRDAVTSTTLTICPVTAGKTYYIDCYVSSFPGTITASFRVGNSEGNLTPVSPTSTARYIAASDVGIRKAYIFTALTTNNLTIYGNNTGTNVNIDYISVKEVLSGAGTRWRDLSNNGNNGTLLNNPTYSRLNNGYLVFDGVSDHVTANDLGTLSNMTCEAVVKVTSAPSGTLPAFIANVYPGTASRVNFALGYVANSTSFSFGIFDGAWNYSPTFTPSLNTWYYVCGSYNGSVLSLYVNGILIGTPTAYTGTATTSAGGVVFGKRWDTAEYFAGNISIAKIYNRALTPLEISQNFEATRGRYNI